MADNVQLPKLFVLLLVIEGLTDEEVAPIADSLPRWREEELRHVYPELLHYREITDGMRVTLNVGGNNFNFIIREVTL